MIINDKNLPNIQDYVTYILGISSDLENVNLIQ